MSSILKALRKLEDEKSALGEGSVDIARDILKRSGSRPPVNRFWPVLSAVLFVLLLSGVFFFVSTNYRAETVATQPIVERISVTRTLPPDPQPDTPIIRPRETIRVETSPIFSHPEPAEKAMAAKESPVVKIKAHAEPQATRPDGMPFLKLTAIAYRANPAERIAVINDLPVMQGTAIEGAEIVSILPDKVVLTWQGKQFEQPIEAE